MSLRANDERNIDNKKATRHINFYISFFRGFKRKSQNGYKQNFIGERMEDVSNEFREPIL